MVAGAVAFVLGAVGGYLGVRAIFGGFEFPDQIAGSPRVDPGVSEEVVNIHLRSLEAQLGLDIDLAVYGTPIVPQYVLFTMELPKPEDLRRIEAVFGPPHAGSMTDPYATGVACSPNAQGASCGWLYDDELVIGLGGVGMTPVELRSVAVELKARLD